MTEKHYLPILQGRQGELLALRELTPETRRALTPLIVVPSIPWDFTEDQPARELGRHLDGLSSRLVQFWAEGEPFYVDASATPDGDLTTSNAHPLTYLLERFLDEGLNPIPVVGLSSDGGYSDAARAVTETEGGGLIRLNVDDVEDPDELEEGLEELLHQLHLEPDRTDLLIDFGSVSSGLSQVRMLRQTIIGTLADIPWVGDWRSLAIGGTSFPRDLSGVQRDSVERIKRSEWLAWTQIAARANGVERVPTFSDYPISHPEPLNIDPRVMVISGSLRYTGSDEWVIVKGRSTRDHGWAQMQELCGRLIVDPDYRGENFSQGDRYIHDCAAGGESTGNATTWRRVGVNHHLTQVVDQIATFPWP